MDLALAVADLAVSRAGAATVSELAALGIPAVFVPYAVGNGEQELNARDAVAAGGALLVDDADFDARLGRDLARPPARGPRAGGRHGGPDRHRRRPRRRRSDGRSRARGARRRRPRRQGSVIGMIKPDLELELPAELGAAAFRRHRRLGHERHRPPLPRGRVHRSPDPTCATRMPCAELRELGARIAIGHDAANVGDADTLVVTGALWQDNPEYQLALDPRPPGAAPLAGPRLADQPAAASSRSRARTARPPRPA